MPVFQYENLSQAELNGINKNQSVIFIAVSPLEQHGPHLPLGVDAFTAIFFSQTLIKKLSTTHSDFNFIIFPPLYLGSDTFSHTGSVETDARTLKSLLYGICKQLAQYGFLKVIFVSGHGGPRHLVVLEEIAEKVSWRLRMNAISASSRILFELFKKEMVQEIEDFLKEKNLTLTADEKTALKADYHGGLIETSVMMVVKPDLVRPLFKDLKAALIDSPWKLRKNSLKKVPPGLGYLGSPALSRVELGQAIIEIITNKALPLIEQFLAGKKVNKFFRSPFYYVPIFRTEFKLIIILIIYLLAFVLAWWFLNSYFMGAL